MVASVSTRGRFNGKVAVVTGSTEGIGLATVERLGSEGATVVVSSRRREKVDKAVTELREKGERWGVGGGEKRWECGSLIVVVFFLGFVVLGMVVAECRNFCCGYCMSCWFS